MFKKVIIIIIIFLVIIYLNFTRIASYIGNNFIDIKYNGLIIKKNDALNLKSLRLENGKGYHYGLLDVNYFFGTSDSENKLNSKGIPSNNYNPGLDIIKYYENSYYFDSKKYGFGKVYTFTHLNNAVNIEFLNDEIWSKAFYQLVDIFKNKRRAKICKYGKLDDCFELEAYKDLKIISHTIRDIFKIYAIDMGDYIIKFVITPKEDEKLKEIRLDFFEQLNNQVVVQKE